jgi:hypothetical protein
VVAPLRNDPIDRIVELEIALLVEGHQRDRGDRLGHRIDAVEGVVGGRLAALAVHLAEGFEIGQVTVARDRDLAAGDLAGLDIVAVQVVGDPFEPLGGEAAAGVRQIHGFFLS